jgi:hypothetical protein
MKKEVHHSTRELTSDNLTTLNVDAIEKAANKHFGHGGGAGLAGFFPAIPGRSCD